jgi:hypothetical protein
MSACARVSDQLPLQINPDTQLRMTYMTPQKWNAGQSIWPLSLGASTVVGSLLLACIFPFAAFAALAALTMTPRRGFFLVTAAWMINQATGFFLMSFPWDAQAVGHGIAILAATLAATLVARLSLDKLRGPAGVRAAAALASAFVVHQILLRAYASVGGGAENFSADIIAAVAVNDVMWFAGLMLLRALIAHFAGERTLSSIA